MKKGLLLPCSLLLTSPLATALIAESLDRERVYSIENFEWTITSEATENDGIRLNQPVLSVSSDDTFDIFSISLSFGGGTWAMEESAFSANYTFSMPEVHTP